MTQAWQLVDVETEAMSKQQSKIRFLKISEVAALTSYSQPSIRRLAAEGKFPPPRKIGSMRQAWVETEVQAWMLDKLLHANQTCGGKAVQS